MKKKWPLILIVVLAIASAAAWRISKKSRDPRLEMQTITATTGDIEETVEATGEVSPLNRVEIKPPIPGRIEKLLFDEGATVKAGDILAWLSSSDRAAILDAARAQGPDEYKYWQDAYKPTPVLAPLSGVIILRNIVIGQTVDASTVLFAMSDKLIVVAQVDEADIGKVKMNMSARITLDAYADQNIDGKVFQILHEGKNVSNVITYDVKIEPKKIPPFFRSQMTANVSLIVRQKENVVLIPSTAVQDRDGEKRVLVPGEKNKPVPKVIETGIESGPNIEVTSGLNAGDTILLSSKKYAVQKGPQTSPLTMGNRSQQQRGGSGGGSGRSGGR